MASEIIICVVTFIGAIGAARFTAHGTLKHLKIQNKYQDTKDNLPILLEILEDLNILQQAFVFNGAFCPPLEHRCPAISDKDGDGLNTMSFAQRGHQFRMVGYRIVRNCRRIMFLTPNGSLLKTLKTCREIKDFLYKKRTSDSKTHLDFMINSLTSYLGGKTSDSAGLHKFSKEVQKFHDKLDNYIEEELPYLIEEYRENGLKRLY
jgi:hypothetical protein